MKDTTRDRGRGAQTPRLYKYLKFRWGERRVFFAERCSSFVGRIKNRRGFAATVLLVPANYGLNKTNVFLLAPSYKKPRMDARVCAAVLAGVFLKAGQRH